MQINSGITPEGLLAEGGVTSQPTQEVVKFTAVSSCVTFTIFYTDGSISAGHIGMFAEKPFQQPDVVVEKLQKQGQGKQIEAVVVIGETGLWSDALGQLHEGNQYRTVGDITKALNPGRKHEDLVDTAKFTQGKGGAYIEASPHEGKVFIKNADGQVLETISK